MFGKQVVRDLINRSAENETDRRVFLKAAGVAGLGTIGATAVAGAAEAAETPTQKATDAAVLNFALNLEYLEAEFYQYAAFGTGLSNSLTSGKGKKGGTTPGRAVNFTTPAIKNYAVEIATDELDHVKFLRKALGGAKVAKPSIDIVNSFAGLAVLAGLATAGGPPFDPYANEDNFLLAAFVFEDVGVTAYKGAAPLITNKTYLEAAAGILAVEAYHAGIVRTSLYAKGIATPAVYNAVNAISGVRDAVDGKKDYDQGIGDATVANLVPTDKNGIAFSRSAAQVLNVVYATPKKAKKGGFFPNGTNGLIAVSSKNGK